MLYIEAFIAKDMRDRIVIALTKDLQAIRTRLLAKYIIMIAQKPDVENELIQARRKRKTENSKIIDAPTVSLAAVALQDMVKGIVSGTGSSVTSEKAEKTEDLRPYKIVNVTIETILPDTRALKDILFGIETHAPSLIIWEVDTRVRNFKEPKELMVKIKVSALTCGK